MNTEILSTEILPWEISHHSVLKLSLLNNDFKKFI